MALQESVVDEAPQWGVDWDIELADQKENELMFNHLEQTLIDIKFLEPDNPRQLMTRLRRLLLRAVPDKVEVNIIRGILTKINRSISND
jgi:tRNA (cytidine32/uridine32-2'-O)-methyltransferase